MTIRPILMLTAAVIGALSAFAGGIGNDAGLTNLASNLYGPHVSAPAMMPPMPPALVLDPRSKAVRLSAGPAALLLPLTNEVYRVPAVPTMHFTYPPGTIYSNYCWHVRCTHNLKCPWLDLSPESSLPNLPDGQTLSLVSSDAEEFYQMVGIPKTMLTSAIVITNSP